MTNRAHRARRLNALDTFNNKGNIIFDHMRRAVREQRELRTVALAIANGQAAPAWSFDEGLIFFDGRLYIPSSSPLLPDILQIIHDEGPTSIEFASLGCSPTTDNLPGC